MAEQQTKVNEILIGECRVSSTEENIEDLCGIVIGLLENKSVDRYLRLFERKKAKTSITGVG